MKISIKFKFELVNILESLKNAIYNPEAFAKLNECDIKEIYTKELKMQMSLKQLSKSIEELILVLSFCDKSAEKTFYNKVLTNCKDLIKYLCLNKHEWFEDDIYTTCHDGQDGINQKFILWEEIEKLVKISYAKEAS